MGGSTRRCRWYDCEERVPDTVRYCAAHLAERQVNRKTIKTVSPSKYDYGATQARPGHCRWVEKERQAGWRLVALGGSDGIPSAWWYECPARVFHTGDSFCAAHDAQAKATADRLATSPALIAGADRICAALDRMAGPFREHLRLRQMAREIDDDPTEPSLGNGA